MEVVVRDLQTLPPAIIGALQKLRVLDNRTFAALAAVKEQEDALLEELAKAEKSRKETGTIADEEYFNSKMQDIMAQRQTILSQLDEKIAFSKTIYEFIDRKIQYLDENTTGIRHLMEADEFAADTINGSGKKKKKRKVHHAAGGDDVVLVNNLLFAADPNEPLYCTCRRVSFGEMVACDNPECSVEWFHFECVGLSAAPEKWFCADCRESMANK